MKCQLGARILAVADSYDAMTTDRPYRSGMPPWKAIEELERCTGTQFDPEVVTCFKTLFQVRRHASDFVGRRKTNFQGIALPLFSIRYTAVIIRTLRVVGPVNGGCKT